MRQQVMHLSAILHGRLLDRSGERLGRVDDAIVRLADDGYPPLTGLKARIGGREVFVPIDGVATLEAGAARLSGERLSLGRFERRDGEVLLAEDLLGRRLVNVEAEPPRLVSAHEIELACIDGWWRLVGVDSGFRARVRRALPRAVRGLIGDRPFLDWTDMDPFVGHVPTLRLRFYHRKLADLHPAEIADLVEAASHDQGEEIIEALGRDRELEADVFEELDIQHQLELIRDRSDAEVAALVARMAPDAAADLIEEMEQERRSRVITLLPAAKQRRIRLLLGYNPSTAGGLMSPEFLAVAADELAGRAVGRVRASELAAQGLMVVYAHDAHGRLSGSVPLADLVRAAPERRLGELVEREPVSVGTGADVTQVARMMTDYDLMLLPVVDEEDRVVGVITVDDVLELTLPTGWRRRFGLARE
ncbi:MAG: magnesium transporter [Acidobacteriota bacterium]|nr:magnesium transporter [Acidobacteriota bacterium]